jgi:prepilin-type N-terminal cleavage/methylation domain-containing protein
MRNHHNNNNNNRGLTLIEMLVAVAIFISLITITLTIFVSGLRAQRKNLAYQQLLDQTSYLMEYMSRAIRMARKDMSGDCTGGEKLNYALSTETVNGSERKCLKFINYRGECQQFCLEEGRIKEIKKVNGNYFSENYLTGPALKVKSFEITLKGETQDDEFQPLVFIFLDIEGKEGSKIQIQTSISQRNLDTQKY